MMNAAERQASTVPPALRDQFLSREEAAAELCMHADTVSKKVSAGVLTAMKYGKTVLICRESVNRYLDQFRHVAR